MHIPVDLRTSLGSLETRESKPVIASDNILRYISKLNHTPTKSDKPCHPRYLQPPTNSIHPKPNTFRLPQHQPNLKAKKKPSITPISSTLPTSAPKPILSTNKDEEVLRGAGHHLQFPIRASARISERIKPAAPSMSCRSAQCVVASPIGGFRFMQSGRNKVVFGFAVCGWSRGGW